MRTLVVGDIHGGFRALEQVLRRVKLTSEDELVFVGDYVDGWSESSETVSYLIDLAKKYTCLFIRGNHDELLYNFLKHDDNNPTWLLHGGESSKKSYANLSEAEIAQHIAFLENLRNYYVDSKNRLFLHAGFTNLHGPEHEYYPNTVYWDRTLWEMVVSMNPNINTTSDRYPKRLQLFSEIYIGHTPTTRLGSMEPLNFANVWNVDTGAAFKGPLSVMDVNTKEVWQSDPVWTLYPEEKGRN
ncbi:metallophosphoesterase family protein [Altibacter sp.]|uniref:metallophosphoesterase family protein n=1 Tax=Altibacter sp. TaxID=2024823 RepID=UPI000C8B20ED|nr:metallophosphoesterase family protein [Altibacter sp.]MAP55764.1 serine/threonine protein phosphatase [Altibacter sp.]|tara:strand:- start:46 stop:771 length:726 start_codon:yes stop_codon:yes gene_type:complete